MKRLFLAIAFLILAFPAVAQVNQVTIMTPLSPSHRLPFSTASVAITSSFMGSTRAIRVMCSVSCAVQTGVSGQTPLAVTGNSSGVTSSTVLSPLVPEYIAVEPNGKIAVIGMTNAGTLYVQEFGR